jgi:hypothetical protein
VFLRASSIAIALLLASALAASTAWCQSPRPPVGRIVGHIDGVSRDGDQTFISGWACQQGQKQSITLHVFGEDPKQPSKTTFLFPQFANLYNEPAVGQACRDRDGAHRFIFMLPFEYGPERKISVHGLRVVNGVPNDAIAGSETKLAHLPGPDVVYPAVPRLAGSYRSLAGHPRVFTTAAELKDFVARINRPGSYSMQRFGLLAGQVKRDLASGIDWDVTYSGCNGGIYTYVFSYEPQDGHDAQTRAALHIAPGAKAPTGAAVVASRLALYAALVQAGAIRPADAPTAEDAAALAKRILLAWAERGFPRDAQGRFLPLQSISCAGNGKATVTGAATPALTLGRGVLYSVHAQDLLQSFDALNAKEESELNAFHAAMFDLLRAAANALFSAFSHKPCDRYSNWPANALASLLATARLLDDEHKLNAVLYGGDHSAPLLLPWVRLFDRVIYGESDRPPECSENLFPDSLTSLKNHANYQTAGVAPGEIADRNRGAYDGQGIGYPMFTLERLFDAAEILCISGYDPYGYRGAHKQSIEMALQYYACYAKGAGFYKIVTAENSGACPNAAQYYGKQVNGVDRLVLIGADRFPRNGSIGELETAARTVASAGLFGAGAFKNEAVLFGKWRD